MTTVRCRRLVSCPVAARRLPGDNKRKAKGSGGVPKKGKRRGRNESPVNFLTFSALTRLTCCEWRFGLPEDKPPSAQQSEATASSEACLWLRFRPLPYVELPVGLSELEVPPTMVFCPQLRSCLVPQVDQFLREQRLEDLNRKLQLQQLEDVGATAG